MSKILVAIASVLCIQGLLLSVCSAHSHLPSPWKHERIPRSGVGCTLILYDFRNRGGQQLQLTADNSDLTDNDYDNRASSLRVIGPCQWILYADADYTGVTSVVGSGTRDYGSSYGTNGFHLGEDTMSSVRCLPEDCTENIVLFQHSQYTGQNQVVSSSNPDLRDVPFDNEVTSVVITGGTWKLYSGYNYQGSSITLGRGNFPTSSYLSPIANDELSSVKLLVCAPGCNKTWGYCENDGECLCRTGWNGTNCDICTPRSGCSSVGGYCNFPDECNCYNGFGGESCNINFLPCQDQSLCRNGATCVSDGAGAHRCFCPPGYMGASCQYETNECNPNPCQNGGSCTDIVNGYKCNCTLGWTGTNCDVNINDCISNPCLNGGLCRDLVSDYSCTCIPGWTGTNCQTNIDDCVSSPCMNGGTCTDIVNGYKCNCTLGWTGTNCDVNINDCISNPCLNGGLCRDLVSDYSCTCIPGWTGTNCQTNIDDCVSSPCMNGGTCTDIVNGYKCNCTLGWTGTNCDVNINDCISNPCLNGGLCRDLVSDYSCTCIPGWTGTNCQTNIDDCVSSPCMNGGTCTDLIGCYICHCFSGFCGRNCETGGDECVFGGMYASDGNLSPAAVAAITAVFCSLVASITGVLCIAVVTVCISRRNKKGHSSKPASNLSNMQEQQQAVPVYEEMDIKSQGIELKQNVAYGPV